MPFDLLEIGPAPAVIRRTLPDLSGEAVCEAAAALTGCAAWILPPKTGEGLARLTGVVEDRGVKRPAIELARTLLKGDGSVIPLIAAGYSSPGKLLNRTVGWGEEQTPAFSPAAQSALGFASSPQPTREGSAGTHRGEGAAPTHRRAVPHSRSLIENLQVAMKVHRDGFHGWGCQGRLT